MFVCCIVGAPGTGKTTFANTFLNLSQHKIVFDITGEYHKHENDPNFSVFFDKEEMLGYAMNHKNCVLIIEEATAFFSYRGYNSELQKLVQLRRHNNHIIVLIYHALKFIPEYLRPMINFIVAFQTNDSPETLKQFPYIKKPLPNEKFNFSYYNQF